MRRHGWRHGCVCGVGVLVFFGVEGGCVWGGRRPLDASERRLAVFIHFFVPRAGQKARFSYVAAARACWLRTASHSAPSLAALATSSRSLLSRQ